MSDADRRRQQSADLARAARARAWETDPGNPEWQKQSREHQVAAAVRLMDTPAKREQQKADYLEEVRRQERWDAEDREIEAKVEEYRERLMEKAQEKRRKERERGG
jgi:hypothetical protein